MSGFEVVGVVLGSLPLIISALEHYAEGIATAKRFWRYKAGMKSLILQIDTERGIFINTLEQLLTGIVRSDRMSDLLSKPGGDTWRDSEVDPKLKERLRGAHSIYVDNVRGMEASLKQMMEKLALGMNGKPQFSDPNAFKQEYKRLKFSLSKSEYDELLSNLRNHNQALTRLTKQSLELEPSRSKSSKTRCPNFNFLQSYAKSLYATISSGWQCGCQGHAVNLRLENRSKRLEREEDVLQQTPFRVVFSYSPDTGSSTSIKSRWKEADIRYIEDKPTTCTPLPPRMPNSTSIASTKRRVRFTQIDLQPQQTTFAKTAITSVSTQTITNNPTPDQIQDLCKAIAQLQQPQRDVCMGYLLDGLKRKHGIFPVDLPPISSSHEQWATYSLRDVLTKSTTINRRLTQHDKLRVAVDLASSVLQLYKTPWLSEDWGKDDVFFIHRPGAPLASIYSHAFVSRNFSTQNAPLLTAAQPPACRVIRNRTLFTLGILLIELWYGRSIEELQNPSDLNCAGTPGVAWCTAERLVENEIEFEAGKRYSDAVRRCIRCDFDRRDFSLDDEGFQGCVYEGVVGSLETTLRQFSGCLD